MIDFAAARTAMVDCQVRPSDVTQYPIIDAMLQVPREAFVPEALRPVAYSGSHIDLDDGRVVLDPRIMGKMLDALSIQPEDLVLDIGCALGYSTALIARLAEAVIGVEEREDWAGDAAAILAEQGADNTVIQHGPLAVGDPGHGPYDVIMLQGGVEMVPQEICDQLKDGGRIAAIFIEGAVGHFRSGLKTGGTITWKTIFDASAPILPGFEAPKAFHF